MLDYPCVAFSGLDSTGLQTPSSIFRLPRVHALARRPEAAGRGAAFRKELFRLGSRSVRTAKSVAQQTPNFRILSENRAASHNYHLLDRYEAGMVLVGTEVKAAKSGKVQLKEADAEVSEGEAWLVNAHFSEYSHGNIMNHPPVRKRK